MTVHGPPLLSAFCGIAFRSLVVLRTSSVGMKREFNYSGVADGSRTIVETCCGVVNYCEIPSWRTALVGGS